MANLKDFHKDNYSSYSKTSCFLPVDLDYPDELLDLHREFHKEMLPKYQLQIKEDNAFSHDKNKNLIPNVGNKRKNKIFTIKT